MLSIYCRISKNRKNQVSIDAQIQSGTELAKLNNWDYEIYIDKGISGRKRDDKRPEYHRLMQDLKNGKIDNVFVYDRSRNDRDVKTWVELAEYLREHGIPLYMKAKDGFNKLNLQDTATYYMQVQFALKDEMYAVETGDKIKDGLRISAERGRGFAIAPLGYKILDEDNDKKLVIDESTRPLVERIFNLSLNGMGLDRMAELFNSEGIPTRYKNMKGEYTAINRHSKREQVKPKSSVKWKGNTIRNIIRNTIYKGERRFGGSVYPAPVIIDTELWQRVNDNLSGRGNNHGGAQKYDYLLKGLVRCGRCDRNYYGRTRPPQINRHGDLLKPKDNFYMCSSKRKNEVNCGNRSINIDVLDGTIWVSLFVHRQFEEHLTAFYESFNSSGEMESIETELKTLSSQLLSIQSDVKSLTLNHARGIYDDKTYFSLLHDIKKDEDSLNKKILSIKSRKTELIRIDENKTQTIDEFKNYIQEENHEVKKEILNKFIDHILINYNEESQKYKVEVIFQISDINPITFYFGKDYKTLDIEGFYVPSIS